MPLLSNKSFHALMVQDVRGEHREGLAVTNVLSNQSTRTTLVYYNVPVTADVLVTLYMLLGREIYTLTIANKEAGQHTFVWDGRDKFGNLVEESELIVRVEAISVNSGERFISARKLKLLNDLSGDVLL